MEWGIRATILAASWRWDFRDLREGVRGFGWDPVVVVKLLLLLDA